MGVVDVDVVGLVYVGVLGNVAINDANAAPHRPRQPPVRRVEAGGQHESDQAGSRCVSHRYPPGGSVLY